MENQNPLRVYCKNCGAQASFDILRQTYACKNCGSLTGIQETKEAVYRWRILQKRNTVSQSAGLRLEEHSCPACGAQIVFQGTEASETCDFCGSRLIRKELTETDQLPELIIPFSIPPEEARKRMLQWGTEHKETPEGRSVVSNMDKLRGYYLPYQLVRGPVYGTVTRDGNDRIYRCAGYLEGTAVNTSGQLDNQVLDEIEPFDWSKVRPFEYGYIAGHHVKLSDISGAETDLRIRKEAAEDFLPEVERVMQSSGVSVLTETGNMNAIPALLPVYFIKSGKLTAVMNGQTGQIAVTKEREKKSYPWMIEPAVLTAAATLAAGFFFHFAPYPMFLSCFVFACIFFCVMGEGRHSLVRRITMRSGPAAARGDTKGHTPVFYEKNPEGMMVPVKIRFYSFGRWLSMGMRIVLTVFLPAVTAAVVRWIQMEPGEVFLDGYRPQYGAAWYVLAGFIAVLYLAKGIRRDVYNHPIVYEILPYGKKRLIGRRDDRKVGILSLFGVGRTERDGKKLTLFRLIKSLGGIGIVLAPVTMITLFGSIAAILG